MDPRIYHAPEPADAVPTSQQHMSWRSDSPNWTTGMTTSVMATGLTGDAEDWTSVMGNRDQPDPQQTARLRLLSLGCRQERFLRDNDRYLTFLFREGARVLSRTSSAVVFRSSVIGCVPGAAGGPGRGV